MATEMNAIDKAIKTQVASIDRIVVALDEVDTAYNYRKSEYRYDQFTRQGARALAAALNSALYLLDNGEISEASEALVHININWNSREDWRMGAFTANKTRAVERLVGLS